MKSVALISGGKDSLLALQLANSFGHEVVAIAHLSPKEGADETDSYMYQSVGSNVVKYIATHLNPDVPYFERVVKGVPIEISSLKYEQNNADEVEDCRQLLFEVKESIPDVQGVVTGAIFSSYQERRIAHVCQRLGLQSIAPLWQWPQNFLLAHLTHFWSIKEFEVRIIKVASFGLTKAHLFRTLHDLRIELMELYKQHGINPCGEGGEFESLVLNCPIYRHPLKPATVTVKGDPDHYHNGVWYVRISDGLREDEFTEEQRPVDSEKCLKLQKLGYYVTSLQYYWDDCGIDSSSWMKSSCCSVKDIEQSANYKLPKIRSERLNAGLIWGHRNIAMKSNDALEESVLLLTDMEATSVALERVSVAFGDSCSLYNPHDPETCETSIVWKTGHQSWLLLISNLKGWVPHADKSMIPSAYLNSKDSEVYFLELLLALRRIRNEIELHSISREATNCQIKFIGFLSRHSPLDPASAHVFTKVFFRRWKYFHADAEISEFVTSDESRRDCCVNCQFSVADDLCGCNVG